MLHHQIVGTGKPVLILHGVTLDHRYMMEVLEPAFVNTPGFKRFYLDFPGHGQSPAQEDIRSQDDLLNVVMGFIKAHMPDEPFALIGLSRGSYIARGIVHQMPDRVSGAALIVPGGNPSSRHVLPDHEILVPDPTMRAELAPNELWAHENLSVVQNRDILKQRRRVVAPAQKLFDAEQDARIKEAFDFSFKESEESQVFNRPSLIVAGRQDSISGYLDSIDLMQRYTRATLAVLDTAGHGLAMERPEVFHALIGDWLARL